MTAVRKTLIGALVFFVLTSLFAVHVNTATNAETDYTIFLAKVLQKAPDAQSFGYEYLVKYPDSPFLADIYYYLSFVEQDYFRNIINLKKLIAYYPFSIWRESALIRLLTLYYLRDNEEQLMFWYDYYLKNFKTVNRRYEAEILIIKHLYAKGDFAALDKRLIDVTGEARNYELLATSLYFRGLLYVENLMKVSDGMQLLRTAYRMFPEAKITPSILLELALHSQGGERLYYIAELKKNDLYYQLDDSVRNKLAVGTGEIVQPVIPVNKTYVRDYYFISIGFLSDDSSVNELIGKLKALGVEPVVKKITDNLRQILVGFFHFKSDAEAEAAILSASGISGSVQYVEYTY